MGPIPSSLPFSSPFAFGPTRRLAASFCLACLAAVVVVLGAPRAEAFRPSVRWIVDQAVKYRLEQGITALEVSADVDRYDVDGQSPLSGTGRILVLQPSSIRIETPRGATNDVKIVTKSKTAVTENGNTSKQKTRLDVVNTFMTIGSSIDRRVATDRLLAAMKAIGVN